ncbi:MAG: anthranilate phosphoribosyltransferase [Bacteriovoracaceae bacterium]|nr:anthranilate phosphoribosyltransferase [Bacteriovoracaceae bacterium]
MNEFIKLQKKIGTHEELSVFESESMMDSMVEGKFNPEQMGYLLASFEYRLPTGNELAGFAQSILKRSQLFEIDEFHAIDVCGTGGDGLGMYNISTCVSFILAGCGVVVAKHGNRSVSSKCGSFDVLEALGVTINHDSVSARDNLSDNGMAFLFAPSFHPAFAKLALMRKNLGVRTFLNALGPLLNPARVKKQLVGVYSPALLRPLSHALKILGSQEGMVVHGDDGNDEIGLELKTKGIRFKSEVFEVSEEVVINPKLYFKNDVMISDLMGGDAIYNALMIEKILDGLPGSGRDIAAINAAAALMVSGVASNLEEGIKLSLHSIDSGAALQALRKQQINGKGRKKIYAINSSFLLEMQKLTKMRIADRKRLLPLSDLKEKVNLGKRIPHDFENIFHHHYSVIAEVKKSSPSLGDINVSVDPIHLAEEYQTQGAVAVSLLTEPNYFSGDINDLLKLRMKNESIVILQKDFIIDEYQIFEAYLFGADAILLIVAMLGEEKTGEFYEIAQRLSLSVLVEVHNQEELEIALKVGAKIIGINNRNLHTLEISLSTSKTLASLVSSDVILISESGIETRQEMEELLQYGFKGFLIGSSLMKNSSPALALKHMLEEIYVAN